MEYRGFEYQVVQTIPRGWRWSVKREPADRTGIADDRLEAVTRAQRFIDGIIARQKRADEKQ
jgi:hypothetical protein